MQTFLAFADLIVFAVLLLVGYIAGRIAEKVHYASIRKREKLFERVTVFSSRFPPTVSQPFQATLVCGSVVVSQDYFKAVAAGLYSIFGGRVRSYESLLDRARRESVLRMKHAAMRKGASMIVNVKFQTSQVPGRGVGAVELIAYGTALRPVA
ncbi:MAG: YbjQ family protein [bacterium]|nr:YbjQ family protein [Betaproteobacteria bacterium]